MSGADSVSSGYRGSKRATKRAACDRCREQKSRCPREAQGGTSESGKCARCLKAGAYCNFSISLRAGRPSASNAKSLSKRKENLNSKEASRETSSSNQAAPWGVLTEEPRGSSLGAASQEDDMVFLSPDGSDIWMGETLDEATDASSRRTTLAGDTPYIPKSSEPFSTREFASMFGGEHLGFLNQPESLNMALRGVEEETNPMDLEPYVRHYSWAFNNGVYPSMNDMSQGQNINLGETSTPTLFTPPEVRMGEASHIGTGKIHTNSRTNSGENLADAGNIAHLQAKPEEKSYWEEPGRLHSTTPDSASSRFQEENHESPPAYSSPTHDIQHRRMHELSELGLSFYSQVKQTTSQDGANPLALSLPNNLAVKVLESSVQFLGLLTSLYPTRPPPCSGADSQTSSSSDGDSPTMSDRRSQGGHEWQHYGSNDIGNSDDPSPQPLDITEVFALLTCYLRVLHLHYLLYSSISDSLTALFQTGAQLPPVFPGVQAGSVSLDCFAKFQVKLLIQISTHVLGEIEMALGLPDGYRISKKDRRRQGIFEGSVSVQFIEMTMKEKGKSGLGIEKDKFTSIRDHLGRLRQLLKGTINP